MITTNEQLQRDVLDELQWEPSLDASGIGVSAKDSVITLTGTVATYAEKVSAEKAAKRVAGVKGVADELEVKLGLPHKRDDGDIARSALDALRWHVSLPMGAVQVVVDKGWVKLDGEVDWRFQRKAAEEAVRNLMGVRGVTNLIRIKEQATVGEVKAKIESALKRSAEVDAEQIRIDIHNGVVTLRGKVRSWAEREEAEDAAWAARGVTNVRNELTVEHVAMAF